MDVEGSPRRRPGRPRAASPSAGESGRRRRRTRELRPQKEPPRAFLAQHPWASREALVREYGTGARAGIAKPTPPSTATCCVIDSTARASQILRTGDSNRYCGESSRRTPGVGSPVTADVSGDRDGAPTATAKSAPTTKSEAHAGLMPTPGLGRVAAHTGQGSTHRSSALPAAGNGRVPIDRRLSGRVASASSPHPAPSAGAHREAQPKQAPPLKPQATSRGDDSASAIQTALRRDGAGTTRTPGTGAGPKARPSATLDLDNADGPRAVDCFRELGPAPPRFTGRHPAPSGRRRPGPGEAGS